MTHAGSTFLGLALALGLAACKDDGTKHKDSADTSSNETTGDEVTTPDTSVDSATETSTPTETVESETTPEVEPDTQQVETSEVSEETSEVTEETSEVTEETTAPLACDHLPTEVTDIKSVPGFTNSEDFQFDGDGHYIGVDAEGNLIRVTKDGKTTLFVPQSAAAAGMRFLGNGDLVYAGSEALFRATPDGVVTTVLGGLAYPNGVEVDLDGFIYVAEQNAGRVRRVDPATGEFTIIARGLLNPNGLSFSADYRTLYCGSFGYGVIYKIPFDADGYPQATGILTLMPGVPAMDPPQGPTDASKAVCAALADGDPCTFESVDGTCVTLGLVLYCDINGGGVTPTDPCSGLGQGDACTLDGGANGTCVDEFGVLTCETNPSYLVCLGQAIDAVCEYTDAMGLALAGTCSGQNGPGLLYCAATPVAPAYQACAGHFQDEACTYTSEGTTTDGTCVYDGSGYMLCSPPIPRYPEIVACNGLAVDAPCSFRTFGGETIGTCQDDFGILYCAPLDPGVQACIGKQPGDTCSLGQFDTTPSECSPDLVCVHAEPWRKACQTLSEGDACEFNFKGARQNGECTAEWDGLLCQPETGKVAIDACIGMHDSAECSAELDGTSYPGKCTAASFDGLPMTVLGCVGSEYTACNGLAQDDACAYLGWDGVAHGSCDGSFGQLYCMAGSVVGHTNLDGVEVDACGNVYVSEYIAGILWRISPDGVKVDELAHLPAQWIPNLHWGNGQGGFRRDRLYVQNRDDGSLFEIDVGVPGKHRNQP